MKKVCASAYGLPTDYTGIVATIAPPSIFSVTPSNGPEAGSTLLTIVGFGFGEATVVRVHASSTSPTNVDGIVINADGTQITCVTRAWDGTSSHTCKIVVTTPYGTASLLAGFTYDTGVPGRLLTEAGGRLLTETGDALVTES